MTPTSERWTLNGIIGIAIVSVAAAAAPLTWRLWGEPGGAVEAAPRLGYTAPEPAPDLSALAAAQPFGQSGTATVSAAGLGLTLKGVLLAVPRSASTAIIAPASGPGVAYFPGEALPGGATIDRVGEDYVVLRTPGGLATLYFPGDERAKAAEATATAAVAGPPLPPGSAPPPPPVSGGGGGDVAGFIGSVLATGNYTVANPPPQLAAQGLQPGDQVRSVNGVDVANLASDPRLVQEAMRAGQVRLMVARAGTLVPLALSVR